MQKRRFWSDLQDIHAVRAAEHKELIATARRDVGKDEAAAANSVEKAAAAKESVVKIARGDDVAGRLPEAKAFEAGAKFLLARGYR
jgi:hypothetical protein